MGNIYDSPTWGSVVGRIDDDGLVYDGVGMFAKCIGCVSSDGQVYDDIGIFGSRVGRFKSNGEVYNESGLFGGTMVGKVAPNGKVYDAAVFSTCVGRSEHPHIFGGGAALLLLIR